MICVAFEIGRSRLFPNEHCSEALPNIKHHLQSVQLPKHNLCNLAHDGGFTDSVWYFVMPHLAATHHNDSVDVGYLPQALQLRVLNKCSEQDVIGEHEMVFCPLAYLLHYAQSLMVDLDGPLADRVAHGTLDSAPQQDMRRVLDLVSDQDYRSALVNKFF